MNKHNNKQLKINKNNYNKTANHQPKTHKLKNTHKTTNNNNTNTNKSKHKQKQNQLNTTKQDKQGQQKQQSNKR